MSDDGHKAREKRWIVLGDDGSHVSVGRHTDPSEAEIATLSEGLRAARRGGWLAVMEGQYFATRAKVTLMMVRPLSEPASDWTAAVSAFDARRRSTLASAA